MADKILVIDDNPDLLSGLQDSLEHRGYHVIIAGDGQEALRLFYAERPDLLILDILMPGGSGIDVLENIKQDGAGPMVIILTNYPYPVFREKCLQAGADFFLDKSTEFDQIPELFERFKWDKT